MRSASRFRQKPQPKSTMRSGSSPLERLRCARWNRQPTRRRRNSRARRRDRPLHLSALPFPGGRCSADEFSPAALDFADAGERVCRPRIFAARVRGSDSRTLSLLQLRRLHADFVENHPRMHTNRHESLRCRNPNDPPSPTLRRGIRMKSGDDRQFSKKLPKEIIGLNSCDSQANLICFLLICVYSCSFVVKQHLMPEQPRGELVIQTIAMPKDTNANGDIFGGWLTSQMDLGSGILAAKTAQARVVTVAMEGMSFLEPVRVGDTVRCYAHVEKIGRTSMTIPVEVWVTRYMTGRGASRHARRLYAGRRR